MIIWSVLVPLGTVVLIFACLAEAWSPWYAGRHVMTKGAVTHVGATEDTTRADYAADEDSGDFPVVPEAWALQRASEDDWDGFDGTTARFQDAWAGLGIDALLDRWLAEGGSEHTMALLAARHASARLDEPTGEVPLLRRPDRAAVMASALLES